MDGDWDWAIPALSRTMQGEQILQPEEVAAMLRGMRLAGNRRAKEFGCARYTVPRHLSEGETVPFRKPVRPTAFDGLDDWLRERFFPHGSSRMTISTRSRCTGNALRGRAARRGSPVGLAVLRPRVRTQSRRARSGFEGEGLLGTFELLGAATEAARSSCLTIPEGRRASPGTLVECRHPDDLGLECSLRSCCSSAFSAAMGTNIALSGTISWRRAKALLVMTPTKAYLHGQRPAFCA
ncbi:hypothetical protein X739_29685 [Mesorhizobium sp. LNHC220B00]|nr:hypothetical protein X739_29685 [Mesorhizobium sp. LNHC220B00]